MTNVIRQFPTISKVGSRQRTQTVKNQNVCIRQRGDTIFYMGETLDGIYLVNAGAVKVFRTTERGDQQIVGFYMPGEIIGLDALSDGISRSTAVALDTTNVSVIPFQSLLSGTGELGKVDFFRRIGDTLIQDNNLIMTLSHRTADRRLAWFLVEFADRLERRGLLPTEFSLPMSRTDIAVYLGLAVETVCRELAKFCEAGLITKNRRRLILNDIETLRHIANGDDGDRETPKRAAIY